MRWISVHCRELNVEFHSIFAWGNQPLFIPLQLHTKSLAKEAISFGRRTERIIEYALSALRTKLGRSREDKNI